MDLEGIGKRNAIEWNVFRLWFSITKGFLSTQCVVRRFNVDDRNVIGKQHDHSCEKLISILTRHVFRLDESRLQETNHEGRRASEGVEDAHAFIGKPLPKCSFDTSSAARRMKSTISTGV